jgi:hypothetical protein
MIFFFQMEKGEPPALLEVKQELQENSDEREQEEGKHYLHHSGIHSIM